MINTVHNLLNELKDKGVQDIEKFLFVKHGPMIGNMYEGLTKELMNKAIFSGLNLKVCSGKIMNSNGDLSNQIDCMIVHGEGKQLPFSEDYVYNINDIVAVIEVKKNLFSNDLASAYNNLLSVKKLTTPDKDMKTNMLEIAYEQIYGQTLPDFKDVKNLSIENQLLYHSLVVESYLPLRIIFGYDGFKSEENLRNAFVDYINKNIGEKGFGIVSFPNLIIDNQYSLIKTNGMPYALATDTKKWIAYASYSTDPLILLLELLWTRLYYMFDNLSQKIFGKDDTIETLNPLLIAEGSEKGWKYTLIPLNTTSSQSELWEPIEITETEHALIYLLCEGREIRVDSESIIGFCQDQNTSIDKVINHLNSKRIACVENNKLVLLTKQCLCIMFNGKYYVGDNQNNQMIRWMERIKSSK